MPRYDFPVPNPVYEVEVETNTYHTDRPCATCGEVPGGETYFLGLDEVLSLRTLKGEEIALDSVDGQKVIARFRKFWETFWGRPLCHRHEDDRL